MNAAYERLFVLPWLAAALAACCVAGCTLSPSPTRPPVPLASVQPAPVQVTELSTPAGLPTAPDPGPRDAVNDYLQAATQADGVGMRDVLSRSERRRIKPRQLGRAAVSRYTPDTTWQFGASTVTGRTARVVVAIQDAKVSPNPYPFRLAQEAGSWRITRSPDFPSQATSVRPTVAKARVPVSQTSSATPSFQSRPVRRRGGQRQPAEPPNRVQVAAQGRLLLEGVRRRARPYPIPVLRIGEAAARHRVAARMAGRRLARPNRPRTTSGLAPRLAAPGRERRRGARPLRLPARSGLRGRAAARRLTRRPRGHRPSPAGPPRYRRRAARRAPRRQSHPRRAANQPGQPSRRPATGTAQNPDALVRHLEREFHHQIEQDLHREERQDQE